jgi:uncharacterized protein
MNPVSGSFDLMGQREYDHIQNLDALKDADLKAYLIERGYIYNTESEHQQAIDNAFAEFNNELRNSQTQLMFIPTYGCNLGCVYCYEEGLAEKPQMATKDTVDAFFEYAERNFSREVKKPFMTLFGGEPLVNSPAQREIIEYFVDKCVQYNYELSAVTNGYDFLEYVDILKKAKIKEMQFTLDGSREFHDKRRATVNKKGTFDKIVEGIAAAVANKMPVNLRSVIDLENIEDLVNLAEFLDQKGWLDLPPELFKTQIGRNYELFTCYAKPQHLLTEVELWGKISSLSKEHPIMAKLHRPDFKGVRHIVDTGEMYMASFDTCPAGKTEWVFDLYGKIYGCTASCGRDEFLLGTYWPEVKLNDADIDKWKMRNVRNIPECKSCKYDVICGGGCGVVAANRNGGEILSPDCRPIQDILDIGINHYRDELFAMAGEDTQESMSGCAVCGEKLIYSSESELLSCSICGDEFASYIKCPAGHFVCDSCHSLDILEKVEKFLQTSEESNPVILAQSVFELPGLKMHGPEYHSIVPAVIVAAQQNINGVKEMAQIREAIRRGKDIKGGSCGFHGVCGAAAGTGIAYSVLNGATPVTGGKRSNATSITGQALVAISENVGPRCCKREAITSIYSYMDSTNEFGKLKHADYVCVQHSDNKECIGKKCPYFPQ